MQHIGTEQAADVLQITESELIILLENGIIPATNENGVWMCELRELVQYIHAQKSDLPPPGATVVITREQMEAHRKSLEESEGT